MPAAGAEVAAAVADAHRREWASVLAATIRVTGDLDSAQEVVQDAYAAALATWGARGVPRNPGAWLTTTARRRALDLARHADVARRALPLLVIEEERQEPGEAPDPGEAPYGDDRLRLVFICCHPTLAPETRIALTLHLVCGLSTEAVARALLVQRTAMAARITRAKHKIAVARIPYVVPRRAQLGERVEAVLDVVHLVYATGHTAPDGAVPERRDLALRGLDLARLLRQLLPAEPEVNGLLALLLLTEARRPARMAGDGAPVLLEQQDRTRWDRAAIAEGLALLERATAAPGRFTLLAAIAAVHDTADSWEATDWPRIVGWYDELLAIWPSPVVALNRAIAVGFSEGPDVGLAALRPLQGEHRLARYPYLHAALASCLERLGRTADAATAYEQAIRFAANGAERADLERRRARLSPG